MSSIAEQIQEMIDGSEAILFMKGDPHSPQCGFSAKVVQILIEVEATLRTVASVRK